ncbi:Protein of unknown function DUF604 [Dillenia turbinata]|uniref:Uncharacterized protein n=1 Tax=Dillenia turbinata TaxID=194707 RepID=A0AAN8ZJG0_9MAGN
MKLPLMRENIRCHLKAWKVRELPILKAIDVISSFMRSLVAICIVSSLSLILYSAFSTHLKWLQCCSQTASTIDLMPQYEETNITHIVFGIASSAHTWNQRRHYSEVWWKPNITRGFLWLDNEPNMDEPWPLVLPPYRVSENISQFKYTRELGSRSSIRIARIVKETFELGMENVRWFVMADDDTVFFTENLVTVLTKYDHNQMYYIGGNSESVEQNVMHSYNMAYGGGGFAISYPLAAELVRVLDGCLDRYASLYGSDEKIQACLSEINVPITRELGFHQVDVRGDIYGLLAAHPVAPLVSLHHLDYLEPLVPTMTQIDALKLLMKVYNADPGRILQQSYCYDLRRNWTVSMAWGYSVQLYPILETTKHLETPIQTFWTWRSYSSGPFIFSTRPFSPDPCERPLIYFFDWVEGTGQGQGQTLTTYKRIESYSQALCERSQYGEVGYFNVSAPIMEPDYWMKVCRPMCLLN